MIHGRHTRIRINMLAKSRCGARCFIAIYRKTSESMSQIRYGATWSVFAFVTSSKTTRWYSWVSEFRLNYTYLLGGILKHKVKCNKNICNEFEKIIIFILVLKKLINRTSIIEIRLRCRWEIKKTEF